MKFFIFIMMTIMTLLFVACDFESDYIVVKEVGSGVILKIEGDVAFCSIGDTVVIQYKFKDSSVRWQWQLSNCITCVDSLRRDIALAVVIQAVKEDS